MSQKGQGFMLSVLCHFDRISHENAKKTQASNVAILDKVKVVAIVRIIPLLEIQPKQNLAQQNKIPCDQKVLF